MVLPVLCWFYNGTIIQTHPDGCAWSLLHDSKRQPDRLKSLQPFLGVMSESKRAVLNLSHTISDTRELQTREWGTILYHKMTRFTVDYSNAVKSTTC